MPKDIDESHSPSIILQARQRAEDELRRQSEWLRITLSSIGDAVISTDAQCNITFMNRVAETLTGWPLAEALGRPLPEVFHIINENTRQIADNPALLALRKETAVGLANHTLLICRDGSERPVDDSAAPIRDDAGVAIGAVLVFRDVTERQRAEETHARLAAIVESSEDAIVSKGIDGVIRTWNAGAERLFGYSAEEAIGQHITMLIPKDRREEESLIMARIHRGERVEPYDTIRQAKDGRLIDISLSVSPMRDSSGCVIGASKFARDITHRVQAAQKLSRSEERLRLALEAGNSGVWDWDIVSGKISWTDRIAEFYGMKPGEFDGTLEMFASKIHPDDKDRVTEAVRAAVEENAPYQIEFRIKQPNGEIRWIFTSAQVMRDKTGRPLRMIGATTDITDKRKIEANLRESEARLRRLASAGIIGIIHWNLDKSLIVDANDEFLRMTGYQRTDLAAGRLNFRSMTPPEWTSRNEVGIQELRTTGIGGAYEKEYFRKDGSRVPVIIAGVRFENSTNEGMSFVLDISDRKLADKALARITADSERRRRLYETILASTPDLVYVFGLDHRFSYANQALLQLWRRTWDEAIGKNCLELGYPDWHAAMHDREIDQVIATKKQVRGEVAFTGAHGRRIYDYIFAPVIGADGEVEAVAGTTRDITERKDTEEELKAADRKKDEFLALLAHELRNPLAPLRNGLQIMRMANIDSPTVNQARAMMDRQLGHMIRLIDDLLDISRINQNKMELRRSRTSLSDIISSAVETARPLIDDAGHELTISLPQQPIFLDADLTRLAQVFSNLLTNSAKYTERGGHIWITAERLPAEVMVIVRDSGIGIPAYALPQIFGMFSQVDRSIERAAGGLGIGLALVKGLVEMHDGSVTAESPGQGMGSSFIVRLPALVTETAQQIDAPDVKSHSDKSQRRILIVDDNQDAASSMALMLEYMHNEVRVANDGLSALEVAEQFRPQVILMDIGMPHMSGHETTRRIRQQTWGQSIVIIALTGWGQEEDKVLSHQAGCNGHLVKPASVSDLEKMLNLN